MKYLKNQNTNQFFKMTVHDFHNLSIIGLASHLINWKITIEKDKNGLKIYTSQSNIYDLASYPRLKHLKFFEYETIEMGRMDIPKNDPLFNIFLNKFSNYLLAEESINNVIEFYEK